MKYDQMSLYEPLRRNWSARTALIGSGYRLYRCTSVYDKRFGSSAVGLKKTLTSARTTRERRGARVCWRTATLGRTAASDVDDMESANAIVPGETVLKAGEM